ncbi:MAG: sxtJ [Candidatus Omnitrophica bacterium]|nr:sxtJ [Candidatus Omnitrophota bacterium]MBU1924124.1 sxtJ [Candidatus Omnitrophota bacterium]
MHRLNPDSKTLRKFGMTMGAAFLVISGLFLFRQRNTGATYSLLASVVFSIAGLVLPILLKSVYIVWMRFAFILGWINTRIILVILFYLIFTPLGLWMRLFRIDLLERKNKTDSFWKEKEKIGPDPLNYERRF